MTPQEIVDYKRAWMMASYFQCYTHSDVNRNVRMWLKDNLEPKYCDVKSYTNVYTDTVRFEKSRDCMRFIQWYKEKGYPTIQEQED